jgi:hypothetical protein
VPADRISVFPQRKNQLRRGFAALAHFNHNLVQGNQARNRTFSL